MSEIKSNRTSWWREFGTETISENAADEHELQCLCGARVVSTARLLTCPNCGSALGVRRVKRQHWKIAPPVVPYRKLELHDLVVPAVRICGCVFLGFYLYGLVNG
jgi:hypothetical protein